MFLTERLVSLTVYVVTLCSICLLYKRFVNEDNHYVLVIYLLVLCLFAYVYKPYITADLYRLREYITYWNTKSVDNMLKYALARADSMWVIYSYFISQTGNIDLLQTGSCFITFGCLFYIINSTVKIYELSGESCSILLFYLMAIGTIFLQTISGIRTMFGFSLVALGIHREYVQKKTFLENILFYLCGGLMHSAVLVIVAIRVTLLAFDSSSEIKRLSGSIIAGAMFFIALRYGGALKDSIFSKGMSYLSNQSEYTYVWEQIIGIIELVEVYYVLRCYKKNCEINIKLIRIVRVFFIISIVSFPFSYSVFRRYSIFSTMISIPIVGQLLQHKGSDETIINTRIEQRILLLSTCIFILSLLRGDICGYKFFVLN